MIAGIKVKIKIFHFDFEPLPLPAPRSRRCLVLRRTTYGTRGPKITCIHAQIRVLEIKRAAQNFPTASLEFFRNSRCAVRIDWYLREKIFNLFRASAESRLFSSSTIILVGIWFIRYRNTRAAKRRYMKKTRCSE